MAAVPCQALVIGGGPAGASAAITLARAGVATHLVERSAAPTDTVCGGFLGADALAGLERIGIDPLALGAKTITHVRLVGARQVVECALPFPAAGLSRRRLDSALAEAAATAGTMVSRGVAAASVGDDDRTVRLKDGRVLTGDAVFLATGKYDLRGARRVVDARTPTSVGLRASLPPDDVRNGALRGFIELHLFDEGYAGLMLQEDETANLCLSVSARRLARAGTPQGLMRELMQGAPLLARRIGRDMPARFATVAGVPYGWRAASASSGLFRLGDQGAVISSLAGDGIAIALASGQDAAAAFLRGGREAARDWQHSWRQRCRTPLAIADLLRFAAERRLPRVAALKIAGAFPALAATAASLTRIER